MMRLANGTWQIKQIRFGGSFFRRLATCIKHAAHRFAQVNQFVCQLKVQRDFLVEICGRLILFPKVNISQLRQKKSAKQHDVLDAV